MCVCERERVKNVKHCVSKFNTFFYHFPNCQQTWIYKKIWVINDKLKHLS